MWTPNTPVTIHSKRKRNRLPVETAGRLTEFRNARPNMPKTASLKNEPLTGRALRGELHERTMTQTRRYVTLWKRRRSNKYITVTVFRPQKEA
jgi:hypothetical protein